MTTKTKKIITIVTISLLCAGLLASVAVNICLGIFYIKCESYLQSTDEIYVMEAGILYNNLEFADGESHEFTYDFDNENYATLKNKYEVEKYAKDGSEFEKALRIMNEFAPRLTHASDYDNHINIDALSLLEYSLDNKNHGINCRNKAQILNEMCLSLGIYSRKVWIMPNSKYDNDCHVVNEVWDTELNKWIMLDITNNEYWVDENGTPLSVLEIRNKGAKQEFCTPVAADDKLNDLQKLKQQHIGDFLYIMKNMVYTEYCDNYGVGESNKIWLLFPKNLDTVYEFIIGENAVTKSPIR